MATNQSGFFILVLSSVAALSSMGLIVIILSVQSLSKNLNLAHQQLTIQQLLDEQTKQILSEYSKGVDINSLPVSGQSKINNFKIRPTLNTSVKPVGRIAWPLSGYSLNSQFSSNLIEVKLSISSVHAQSRINTIGLICLQVESDILDAKAKQIYTLALGDENHAIPGYEVISENGEIWRNSVDKKLLLKLDVDPGRLFGRANFVLLGHDGQTQIAIILTDQHKAELVSDEALNRLLIIFDKVNEQHSDRRTLTLNDLTDINTAFNQSDSIPGFYLTLDSGDLVSSAITIADEQIHFVTQSVDKSIASHSYKNKFYRINLNNEPGNNIQVLSLNNTNERIQLRINTQGITQYSIGTQFNPSVFTYQESCKQHYHYET